VVRYSFLVRNFHPLLHAGLPRRTNISIALSEAEKGEVKAHACDMAWLRHSLLAFTAGED
jgi:hypothetical protein